MIAPIRQTDPETNQVRRQLQKARQAVASTLLRTCRTRTAPAPPIPAWQAWLFTAWMLLVMGAYFASMFGVW